MQAMKPSVPAPSQESPSAALAGWTNPVAIYEAYKQQRAELQSQLQNLLNQRAEAVQQIEVLAPSKLVGASRMGLEDRIARLDQRIAGLEEQIVRVDAQVASAAAAPGAVHPPPPPSIQTDGLENFGAGMATSAALIFTFLYLKGKLWRRKRNKAHGELFPPELTQRMERLENVAESTAIEVERIGEGQRFVTKILSEKKEPAQNKGV